MALRGAVYVNGIIKPAGEAVVPVYDHGFLYGEGVYETLRTYNRVPFLYDRHMGRLRASAGRIRLDVPFGDAELARWIDATVVAADASAAGEMKEAYIRILFTRGVGELNYDPKSTPTPTTVIIVKPLEEPPARVFEQGINICLVDILRNHPDSVNPLIKANNLLNNALAMQEAYRRGGEEGLMCNYRGELSECSQANFFMVRNGVVLTPKSEAGLLEGITRAFLFEVGKDIGVDVQEATLFPKDLATADEAFITSTTRELSPVTKIDGKPVGTGKVGSITNRMLAGYRKRAQETTSSAAVRS
jgi:branched-chain amino acid aminotransferase